MRHSTFRQLEIFEAIARLGSFTRAAEELHLTQPTVSMQMKKLCEAVGAPLVEQLGKKILLTEDGRELAQASRDIFTILDRYAMSVAQRRGLEKGRLKLMAITTAVYFAPRLLGDFARLHPGIDVSLRVTNKEQVLASMADNLDDLYLLGTPPDEIDVVATPIMDNPIVVLCAPGHALTREGPLSLERLAREPWLLREVGSGTRKAVEHLLAEGGVVLCGRLEDGRPAVAAAGGALWVRLSGRLDADEAGAGFWVSALQGGMALEQLELQLGRLARMTSAFFHAQLSQLDAAVRPVMRCRTR